MTTNVISTQKGQFKWCIYLMEYDSKISNTMVISQYTLYMLWKNIQCL